MNTLKRKPLQSQALIYDKDCPMCCVYTSAFIKAGVLEENGRQPYNENAIDSKEWDAERAKNEIALVNYENGTVTYGIDSMFTVIGHRFGFLKPLFSWKPFHWSMKKLYSFISYNRKVIAPPAKNAAEITCVPDVNLTYRWMYIAFAIIMAAGLNALALASTLEFHFWTSFMVLLSIISARIITQSLLVKTLEDPNNIMDYIGNLVTINLQLAFLVAVFFFLLSSLDGLSWLAGFYLIAVQIYIYHIHLKRLNSLDMDYGILLLWAVQWVFIFLISIA